MSDLDPSVAGAVRQGMGDVGVEEWMVPSCLGSRLSALARLGSG